MTFKEDIVELLMRYVGESARGPIEVYYSDLQKLELAEVAYSLLCEYLGEPRTKEIMTDFMKGYPEFKRWRP